MNALVVYMVKTAFYLAAFYFVYLVSLKWDTEHFRNRVYLLISVIISFVLPLITINTGRPLNIPDLGKLLSEVKILGTYDGSGVITGAKPGTSIAGLVNYIYISGIILTALKFSFDFLNLIFLICRHKGSHCPIIKFNDLNTSGFSALGRIFVNAGLTGEEAREVVRHENSHLRLYHFIDIIFIETVKIFQWFNPFIYLINRSLREVHEYQADEECLHNGISLISYQKMLLNNVFRTQIFRVTDSFSNPSLIRKRMLMMTKKHCSQMANLKILLVVPVIASIMILISAVGSGLNANEKNGIVALTAGMPFVETADSFETAKADKNPNPRTEPESYLLPPPESKPERIIISKSSGSNERVVFTETKPYIPLNEHNNVTALVSESELIPEPELIPANALSTEPFIRVEEMPVFKGGDAALLRHIAGNAEYPSSARDAGIEGRVIVRFAVDEDGSVNRISVLKGVAPELDAEAMRVVKQLPKFTPGRQNGVAVPVWYMVPITFTLKTS